MATIQKIGKRWRARVRKQGFPAVSEMFDTKARAQEWASKVESDMRALKFQDERIISDLTLGTLIDRYTEEIGAKKPFGKNKTAVLASLKTALGDVLLPNLTSDRLVNYIAMRSTGTAERPGAGGVTIAIDLTYLGGVLKTAKQLWRLPVNLDAVAAARANMDYLGLSTRSEERQRRPTLGEIESLCAHFDAKKRQRVPMSELIHFAIGTAMRIGEIIRLKWSDLNESDRTIIIRDRKHPRAKKGNDQEVPLLGNTFEIAKRQPKKDGEPRIFPVTNGTVSTIFPRACNALEIEDLCFHDLRHEGVSRLFEQGYSIEQVALVSGHKDWKMLARYTQIRAKDLHR
ncbi:site-specific integrase [Collimonas pratensis]|nr:site-specific integrase [Collimonas pratensis]